MEKLEEFPLQQEVVKQHITSFYTLPPINCDVCGTEFLPRASNTRRCSPTCTKKAHQGGPISELKTLDCIHCGKEFIQNRSIQKYCSLPCMKKANQIRNSKRKFPSQQSLEPRAAKISRYHRHYGIELDDFEALVAEQVFCEICGFGEGSLVPDHDHVSGQFRGALCGQCNKGIGHFVDDPDRLVAAAAYLIQFKEQTD